LLKELEIRRQVAHLIGGIIYVALIYLDVLTASVAGILLLIYILISIISRKMKIPLFSPIFELFEREEDLKKFPGKGTILFMASIFICLLLFPKDIAMASIVILAIGDSIGPLVGQYGNIKSPFNKKKYIEGGIAGGIAATIGAMIFVSPLEAAFAATIAMIAEGVDWKLGKDKLDDNIIMPLVAGGIIMLLRWGL